jgi:ATP-dependent Clp protease ATP-binding subunit ClpB
MSVLRDHFRPEFLNRVDDVIVFRALNEEQLTAIVDIQLRRLEQRLAERRVTLAVTEAGRKLLAKRGWDPVYGARPLKRAIQRLLQDPRAMKLLLGRFTVANRGGRRKDGELTSPKGGWRPPSADQLEQTAPCAGSVRLIR